MSMAYQNAKPFPTEVAHLSKLSVPIAQDSPTASYDTLVTDELIARGVPNNRKNVARILHEIRGRRRSTLRTVRLQRIWDQLYGARPFPF
jgi:hypothetical protein